MNWKELKDKIYYWDGSWRDIYVLHTSLTDWEKWIGYVNANYKINWFNGKVESTQEQIDFEVIKEYLNGNFDLCSTATVFVGKI